MDTKGILMRTIFIIHGSYGNPQENWFPWLKTELEKLGCRVIVPQFQVPEHEDPSYGGHKLSLWLETLSQYSRYINDETIFVGHSRGCVFLYRVLEQLQHPVHAVFFVGAWMTYLWYAKGSNKPDSFHETPLDWKKIKAGSRYFEVYQSTNDEIPVADGQEIAKKLQATLHIIENAGHFNVARDPSYITFPLLLESIKKQL